MFAGVAVDGDSGTETLSRPITLIKRSGKVSALEKEVEGNGMLVNDILKKFDRE